MTVHDDQYSLGSDSPWPFGVKYNGTLIRDLPLEYLVWVAKTFKKGSGKSACKRQIALSHPNLAMEMGIKVDEPCPGGGYIQGRMDCSHLYRPGSGAHLVPWDGISPPFDVDDDELSKEFREMFLDF